MGILSSIKHLPRYRYWNMRGFPHIDSLIPPRWDLGVNGGLENILRCVCLVYGFSFSDYLQLFFDLVRPFAPSCFREFHSPTSFFLASLLLVLSWELTNWICCAVITTPEWCLLPFPLFSHCSHHSGFYRCPSSLPQAGFQPVHLFLIPVPSIHDGSSLQWWIFHEVFIELL